MRLRIFALLIFMLCTAFTPKTSTLALRYLAKESFDGLQLNAFQAPRWECFAYGFQGYYKLEREGRIQNPLLTLIDFSLPSTAKRLWVIDMTTHEVIQHTYVAHGMNSGLLKAADFSNQEASFKSSLGFYLTQSIYHGKHGISLKLQGLETGFNDQAEKRCIVMHGATYVSSKHIKIHKRLGRSQGCPAIEQSIAAHLIPKLQNQSCLFIFAPQESYLSHSSFITETGI